MQEPRIWKLKRMDQRTERISGTDGDTGTNMTMTIMAAAAEVGSLGEPDMESLAKAISSGSLRGARGNSGVILSQLLRGFTRSVKNSKELDAIDIAAAMEKVWRLHIRQS